MAPNKISAWSKSSRKSRGPSAPRLVLLPSAVFVGTSLLWRNKAIVSAWSPVNSLLGFHSPLLALYSHVVLLYTTEKAVFPDIQCIHAKLPMEEIMQNVTTTKRPLGITILSVLMFIQAILEIILGVFAFIGSTFRDPLVGLLVGWVPLAVGVLLLILAWGLWTLKPWAYWGTLILE